MKASLTLVAAALMLGGCASEKSAAPAATETAVQTLLEEAVETCVPSTTKQRNYARVGDAGRSVSLDGKGADDFNGVNIDELGCVLAATNVPDHVISQMESTRAMDGVQKAEWEGWSASWSYHPDDGMNLILVQEEQA